MGSIAGNMEYAAGFEDYFLAGEMEPQPAFLQYGELLVAVSVFGYNAAFGEFDTGDGDLLAMDDLPHEQRVHSFFLDLVPVIVCHGGYCSV